MTHSHAPKPDVMLTIVMPIVMPIAMPIVMTIMMTILMPIMMMDDLREVVESTGVVKVAVSGDDDNVLPYNFCISQVGKQAVLTVLDVKFRNKTL